MAWIDCPRCNYPSVTIDKQGPWLGIYKEGTRCDYCYYKPGDSLEMPSKKKIAALRAIDLLTDYLKRKYGD
jgi:hypothetical protein